MTLSLYGWNTWFYNLFLRLFTFSTISVGESIFIGVHSFLNEMRLFISEEVAQFFTSYEFHDADLCVNLGFKDLFFSLKTEILSDLSNFFHLAMLSFTGYEKRLDLWSLPYSHTIYRIL